MIRIAQIGVGSLGQKVVRFALEREGLRIVSAVDPASDKAGRDLGSLCGVGRLNVPVCRDLRSALKKTRPQVAVVTTVSSITAVEKQIREIAAAGLHIVSTCEELSFPWRTSPRIAARIDRMCKKHGVACLGTGVNPGFLMDFLPCVMTSVCQHIRKVKVSRVQDASVRRIPFQQKIGAGLTRKEFKAKVATGTLRHVGLAESAHMVAHSVGWELDRVTETLKPVIARERVTSGYLPIRTGMARGVEQVAKGYVGSKEVIRLHFRAAVGEATSFDNIEITGTPGVKSVVDGGINGDIATCAITVNAVRAVLRARSGLNTMLDIPVPGLFLKV